MPEKPAPEKLAPEKSEPEPEPDPEPSVGIILFLVGLHILWQRQCTEIDDSDVGELKSHTVHTLLHRQSHPVTYPTCPTIGCP